MDNIIFICTLVGGMLVGYLIGIATCSHLLKKHGLTWNQIFGKYRVGE